MTPTLKESFSGPSVLILAAKKAAAEKFGGYRGAWSRWLCEAINEKQQRETPVGDCDAMREQLLATGEELGMDKALAILSRQLVRTTRPAARSRRAA